MDAQKLPVNELAKACARSAEAAEWEEFLRRCTPLAVIVASRVARIWSGTATPAIVDDIVQEVFLKLCDQERKILRDFKPQGEDSFLGLLRVVTGSVGNDYFRRQHSEKRGGKVVTVALEEELSPVALNAQRSTAEMQRAVLFSELDRRLKEATGASAERDRTIFWLYYLQGLTADEIAELPASGLSAKGVESALRRVITWLRKEMAPPARKGSAQPAGESG